MVLEAIETKWYVACRVEDVPEDGGVCALIEGQQIAVFNFTTLSKWYAHRMSVRTNTKWRFRAA